MLKIYFIEHLNDIRTILILAASPYDFDIFFILMLLMKGSSKPSFRSYAFVSLIKAGTQNLNKNKFAIFKQHKNACRNLNELNKELFDIILLSWMSITLSTTVDTINLTASPFLRYKKCMRHLI